MFDVNNFFVCVCVFRIFSLRQVNSFSLNREKVFVTQFSYFFFAWNGKIRKFPKLAKKIKVFQESWESSWKIEREGKFFLQTFFLQFENLSFVNLKEGFFLFQKRYQSRDCILRSYVNKSYRMIQLVVATTQWWKISFFWLF